MNNRCQKIQNQIPDYILGLLGKEQTDTLNEHISQCSRCKKHLQSLENENRLLMQLGRNLDTGMTVRRERAVEALSNSTPTLHREAVSRWRMIMKNRITKLAAAAVIILAALLSISVLDKSVTPAYAVEQTVDAIRKIENVYMAGEFYKQGKFECWMKYDGDPDRPTHVWLGRTGHNMCKICSPEGVFGLNQRSKAVHFARRDERDKNWFIKFGSFFEDAVRQAQKTDSVEIHTEKNPETGKEHIVVHIETTNRDQMFLVDPKTKLPTSFTTLRDDNPTEMMKMTLAVKNLEEIRYNEQPPEGIFEMPPDAVVVESEVDCMVDPDSGLVADSMTQEQACLEIAKQTGRALVEIDRTALCKLDLFFRLWPDQIWEQVRKMKENGQWVKEVAILGEPYQEGQLWYVPMEVRGQTGQNEIQNAMIKFYEMEGKNICFIIGSKEKGVVD